ncbi:MAG TPA: hypothetical protein VG944_19130 [Fimbriimonas sp.]|nr:hypothetical protein [Fimbriimonas sp.]
MQKIGRAVICLLPCVVLTQGCSTSTPQATAQQAKAFQGGPMPPDVMQKFKASQEAAIAQRAEKARAAAMAKGQ